MHVVLAVLSYFVHAELLARSQLRKKVGGRVNAGGHLAGIKKNGGGYLPVTWALMVTRPKNRGGHLPRNGRLLGMKQYYYCVKMCLAK